jgi:hypothetical protein
MDVLERGLGPVLFHWVVAHGVKCGNEGFLLRSEDYGIYSGMRLSKGVGFPELQRKKPG